MQASKYSLVTAALSNSSFGIQLVFAAAFLSLALPNEGSAQQDPESPMAEKAGASKEAGHESYLHALGYDHGLRIDLKQNAGLLQIIESDGVVERPMLEFNRKNHIVHFNLPEDMAHMTWLNPLVEVQNDEKKMLVPMVLAHSFCVEYSKRPDAAVRKFAFVQQLKNVDRPNRTALSLPPQLRFLHDLSPNNVSIMEFYERSQADQASSTGDLKGTDPR